MVGRILGENGRICEVEFEENLGAKGIDACGIEYFIG
jgi:hypothetical protein